MKKLLGGVENDQREGKELPQNDIDKTIEQIQSLIDKGITKGLVSTTEAIEAARKNISAIVTGYDNKRKRLDINELMALKEHFEKIKKILEKKD